MIQAFSAFYVFFNQKEQVRAVISQHFLLRLVEKHGKDVERLTHLLRLVKAQSEGEALFEKTRGFGVTSLLEEGLFKGVLGA